MNATTAAFRAAVERGDLDGVLAACAPDVVVHSPITDLSRFEGHAELRTLLEDVLVAIREIRYTQDVGDDEWRALFYTARVGGVHVDEATRVRLGRDGRIAELWLYFRPLPGLAALTAALGVRLARRQGRMNTVLAIVLVKPLAVLLRLGDRIAVRLVGLPSRPRRS